MEYIWDKIPKQKNKKTIHYLKGDLAYLYGHGFVDSRRFSLEEWKNAFLKFSNPDGSYFLNKEQFLSLHVFRPVLEGDINFDPMNLRDGSWTDQELKDLFFHSIQVVSDIRENTFWCYINTYKEDGVIDNKGNLIVDDSFKEGLLYLINEFPSPRRKLQKEASRITNKRLKKISDQEKDRDKSDFVVGEKVSETTLSSLKNLQSLDHPKKDSIDEDIVDEAIVNEDEQSKEEIIDIKSLRKPGGKVFG